MITLTVKRPQDKDRFGDPIGPPPDDGVLEVINVAPRTTEEDGNTVFTGLTVYAPPGQLLDPADRVLVPGYTGWWEVDGLPGRWDLDLDSNADVGGVEIPLRQVR